MTFEDLKIQTKSGKVRYSTICPQCNETRQKHKNVPCLTVNDEPDNRWWHCNHPSCGWSGNLDLHDKFIQVQEKSRMPKQIAETYSKEVREYLEGRGIDQKTALKEKVYEFPMKTPDGSKPIMGFPFYINLTLVNVKYFDVRWQIGQDSPKWWQMKKDLGTKSIFLGMQSLSFDVDEKKEVLICEGEFDWLTWKQAGYKNVVSVPMGAPNPDAKNFDHEFDYANDKFVQSFFADVENIIFSTDNDAPGHKLRNQLALIFGKERCKYINYQVGYKDINEVWNGDKKKNLKALGQGGVDECHQNLSSFPISGVIRPSDCREDLDVIVKNGFTAGLGIGIPEVDRLYTLKPKQITFVSGIPSSGKALDIATPIPIINGFKTMGDIQIGDILFDENGDHCNVINATEIMYNRPCYKLTFSDNTKIIADEDHLWETTTISARRSAYYSHKRGRDTGRQLKSKGTDQSYKREKTCLKTTKEIFISLKTKNGNRYNHNIKIAKPIKWNSKKKLLIDSYILGVWLGDGDSGGGRLYSADIEIINEIKDRGYEVSKQKSKYNWGILNIRNLLVKLNLLKNKHIPPEYIYTSIQNRIDLLMGLMDTDGYMDEKKNVAEFCSTNKNLADGIYEILCSLGMNPKYLINESKLYGRFVNWRYRINFRPIIPVFKLKRKLEKQNLIKQKRTNSRFIWDCIKIDSVPVKCIEVDSKSRLFLCSKSCIPTHNSTYIRWYITELIRHNSKLNLKFAMFTPENRPVAREYAKIAEVMTGQYYREGWQNSMSAELRNKTMRFIEKHFFVVSPDRKNFESFGGVIKSDKVNTMESILKYLIYLKKTENIFGFVIDAWNKIEHEQPRNMTETSFISQQLDFLLDFCDLYDVHGIVIVHPRKVEQQGINYKMPTLYDIKGSSAWKEKADIGIILHRNMNRKKRPEDIPDNADEDDKYYVDPATPTILRTEKIRFEEIGVMDRVKLVMDMKKGGRFYVYQEKKGGEAKPIEGKLNPPKEDDVFENDKDDEMGDLPF